MMYYERCQGRKKYALISFPNYTKTGLVFGFSKNQILVAVIPGLKNAEDFPRTKSAEDFPRTEKRRGRYSGKIVFGLLPKTVLR
jgi:hypothetical protein